MTSSALPEGSPHSIEWGGIIEGKSQDSLEVERAADRLSRTGLVNFSCEFHGARFTILPEDERVAARAFDGQAQAAFLRELDALLELVGDSGLESTLHVRMHYPDVVAETLFVFESHGAKTVSRIRAREKHGTQGGSVRPPGRSVRLRLAALIGALVLTVTAWMTYPSWADLASWPVSRIGPPRTSHRIDIGEFAGVLQVYSYTTARDIVIRAMADPRNVSDQVFSQHVEDQRRGSGDLRMICARLLGPDGVEGRVVDLMRVSELSDFPNRVVEIRIPMPAWEDCTILIARG